jgi:hypothetical protein
MSRGHQHNQTSGGSDGSAGLILTCLCIGAAIWFFVAMLGQVFSWHGLLYSFGMADPTNLKYPIVVRVLTFGIIAELGVLVSASLDWRDGMRFDSALYSWLMAHATLITRIVRLLERVLSAVAILGYAGWMKIATDRPRKTIHATPARRPNPLVVEGEVIERPDDSAAVA